MSEAKQTSIEQGDTLGPGLFTKGLNVVFPANYPPISTHP